MNKFFLLIGLLLIVGGVFSLTQEQINAINSKTIVEFVNDAYEGKSSVGAVAGRESVVVSKFINTLEKVEDSKGVEYFSVPKKLSWVYPNAFIIGCYEKYDSNCESYLERDLNFKTILALDKEKAMVFSWKTKGISQRSYIDDFLAWIGKFLIGAKG
jgi:hypothetical protein